MGRLRSKRKAKQRQQEQEQNVEENGEKPLSEENDVVMGIHGVRLKHFEKVLAYLLPQVQPHYVALPAFQKRDVAGVVDDNDDYPFSTLPSSARVLGEAPGQLSNAKRAARKEGQLSSMMRCIFPLIVPKTQCQEPFTIVDFGGGSGHLGIPLSLMLPQCRIIVVDFNKRSIQLMHEKAEKVIRQIQTECTAEQQLRYNATQEASKLPQDVLLTDSAFRSCANKDASIGALANLFSFQGPVEEFSISFDMALALHLCGEATDVAIRKAVATHAAAMVVAPCCVGKLSQKAFNPDVFNATGQNHRAVSYPQSSLFCRLVGGGDNDATATPNPKKQQDDWDALARAADYSNEQECGTRRNATRRTAKALVETDRCLFLEEQKITKIGDGGYVTVLTKMAPLDATPKNDILVAWRKGIYDKVVEDLFSIPNMDCQADMEVAKSHLVTSSLDGSTSQSDWTQEEEESIKSIITAFLEETKDMEDHMDQVYLFPPKMGARKRKLIHFVAGKMDLAHWSHGDKDSLKTVAVARRGRRHKIHEEIGRR
jgi:Methyltransferase domain/R3H domain